MGTGDVKDTINDVGQEYHNLVGDVFREVFGGNTVGVGLWLRGKGDPNQYNNSTGWTPLIMAVSCGDLEIAKMLMESFADPRLGSTGEGTCPMHLAVQKNTISMAKLIMEVNESVVKDKNLEGGTPL